MAAEDVFEEWNAYARKKALLGRDFDFGPAIRNAAFKVAAITGIRRSGKSSLLILMAQALSAKGEKACYINMEDDRIKDEPEILDKAIKWFGDEGLMLLDEITSIKGWEGWLARTHELLKGRLKIIVSSSRRGLLVPNKPLRGRVLAYEFYPLSFREFLGFKGMEAEKTTAGRGRLEKAFFEYLKYGGFPEAVIADEEIDKIRILNSYFRDIVSLDVAEASRQDINTVETFGKYAVQTTYFSASKCLNFFKTLGHKIGKEKLLKLEHYSQAGYLFFFVQIFSYKLKDKSQYPRKAYCGDTGFIYSTTGKVDMGRLFENAAFLELKRRAQGQAEICYWKNKEGLEVDFVVKQGTNIKEIIQSVYDLGSERTMKRELDAIVECAKELKAANATVLTKDIKEERKIGSVKVRFIPLMDWLLG